VTREHDLRKSGKFSAGISRSNNQALRGDAARKARLDRGSSDGCPGALWNRDQLEECRRERAPELTRIVVTIDPATSSNEDSDETRHHRRRHR
jgi:phage terminase large subunit-like protein